MEKVASLGALNSGDLPSDHARSVTADGSEGGANLEVERDTDRRPDPAIGPAADHVKVRTASTGTLVRGVSVRDVLSLSSLSGATLLAGERGLDRIVQRLNVMEVPDILPWTKPHELLLTTGYPLRETPQSPCDLVTELESRRLAAVGIKLGRYLDELPADMLAAADRVGLPIIRL